MADREELLRLASLCEAASEECGEIDASIGVTIGLPTEDRTGEPGWHGRYFRSRLPNYTASIDAARLLVPEGHAWSVSNVGPDDMPQACVTLNNDDCTDIEGHAATPALALAAASLRARAQDPLRAHGGGK